MKELRMMCGKRKNEPMVDKIEKMKVYWCKHADMAISFDEADVFLVQPIYWNLTENAKNQQKTAEQDFILLANERFCSDCYWSIYTTHHYYMFDIHKMIDNEEMVDNLKKKNSIIAAAKAEDSSDMYLMLNDMDASVFTMLKESEFSDGKKLNIGIDDVGFTAYYPHNLNDMDVFEAIIDFNSKKMELDISFGVITFPPKRMNDVKKCLIEAYIANGIELEFCGEWTNNRKTYFEKISHNNGNLFEYLSEVMPQFTPSERVNKRENDWIGISLSFGIFRGGNIEVLLKTEADEVTIKAWANRIKHAEKAVKLVRKVIEAR